MTPTRMLDVLIVTSSPTEHDAVLAVETGAVTDSSWEPRTGPAGLRLSIRSYLSHDGGALRVGLALVPGMGMEGAAAVIKALLSELRSVPRCIVSCGICAGRSGAVNVGDAILADRVLVDDTTSWSLDVRWAWSAAQFTVPSNTTWLRSRPLPLETQASWVLTRLAGGADPISDPERAARCPDWKSVLVHLRGRGLLTPTGFALTDAGRADADELRLLHPDGLPEAPAWRVHYGPIEMVMRLTEGSNLAVPGARAHRASLSVELDSSVIAALPALAESTRCLVVRGVSDLGDAWKDDRYQSFAARAAAECALSFVCDRLGAATIDDVVDAGTATLPVPPSPSALLQARYTVAPFHGRAETLAELRTWCSEGDTVRTRLVYADGGMGKTRLAIELCERLRRDGWVAGFLRDPPPMRWFEGLWESDRPVLMVIDYAERRAALPALLEPIARHRNGWNRAPFRVLLLARSAGDWWGHLTERDSPIKDLLAERSPVALLPLVPMAAERGAIVREAAAAFAEVLHRPLPATPLPALDDSGFDRALYLHMAALTWVEGRSFTAETLMTDILEREERFWLTRADSPHDLRSEALLVENARRAVAGLTLSGGALSEEGAKALLRSVNNALDERLLALLRDLYPGRREGALDHLFLSGLEPDLLGEAMVWRALCIVRERGDAVEVFLDRVFEGATERALVTGFEVLGRLSADHSDAVRPWIAHLLAHDLTGRAVLALEASKAIGMRTAHAFLGMELAAALEREGTVELAERLEAAGFPDFTVSLREVRAWVTKTLLSLYTSEAASYEMLANRARLLNNLGISQSELGLREAALASTLEAVEIRRALAKAQPDVFLPDLAASLNSLGATQHALGLQEAALASTREAVEVRRALAKARPDAFLPDLAKSLNNMGGMQGALGQREAALASTWEAAEIRRALAKARPDAFLPDLAASLNNLGNMQSALGQWEAALVSTQEAVEQNRALAKARPDAFLPDLAASLNNLGNKQTALGQRECALTSTQEAVEQFRVLAKAWPDAYLPHLAMSLSNLGGTQSDLGEREAALASMLEAVEHYRALVKARPDAYLPGLAMSLDNLGLQLGAMGRHEDALVITRNAVELGRTLTKRNADAFLPALAKSLYHLARGLHELGRSHEAPPVAQEALDLLWPFYERLPNAHGALVGSILGTMADLLKILGQPPDKQWNQRMTRYLALSGS